MVDRGVAKEMITTSGLRITSKPFSIMVCQTGIGLGIGSSIIKIVNGIK